MDQKLALRLQQGLGFAEFQSFANDQQAAGQLNPNAHQQQDQRQHQQQQEHQHQQQIHNGQRNGMNAHVQHQHQQQHRRTQWNTQDEIYPDIGLDLMDSTAATTPTTQGPQQRPPVTLGYDSSTTQPLWSLYPNGNPQGMAVDSPSSQFDIRDLNNVPTRSQSRNRPLSNQNGITSDFMPFASETHQQRQSLLHGADRRQTNAPVAATRASFDIPFDTQYQQNSSRATQSKQTNSYHDMTARGPANDIVQPAPAGASSASAATDTRIQQPQPHNARLASRRQQREDVSPRGYLQHLQSQQVLHTAPSSQPHSYVPSRHASHGHTPEVDDHRAQQRARYKVKSSIPPDVSHSNYAQQCIAAAESSRLPPFQLHTNEYNLLRPHLPYMHVTTYLNIRNGILRLWLSNPMVNVTMAEAAGCVRDERYYGLAEVAYDFLVRNGYINYGCLEHLAPDSVLDTVPEEEKLPRKTIVVIGAGIAGLGSARQLDALLRRYSHHFTDYEDIPRIIVLEGRRRIGGRIYSAPIKSSDSMVDMGAQMIMGYGKGNPLAVLIRRQLGLPIVPVDAPTEIYDADGQQVDENREEAIRKLFKHILDRMSEFKTDMPAPNTARGDEVLMRAAKDPPPTKDDEFEMQTISKLEENGELPKPYENPGELEDVKFGKDPETEEELNFLRDIGLNVKNNHPAMRVVPEPQGEMHPSLGQTMDSMIEQFAEMGQLTEQDVRLLNWHLANLEFSFCTNADNLSLGSWNQDEGNEFAGRHSMIQSGYQSLTRGLYVFPDKLDVRFRTSVKVIEYEDDQCQVFLENGERITADRVLVTVPLGVLKNRTIQFIPDLPQWKTDSIERLGFGVMNKVCLIFDHMFWDESKDIVCVAHGNEEGTSAYDQQTFKSTRGHFYMFWNCTKQVGQPCLMGLVTGDAAVELANVSDSTIVEEACSILKRVFNEEFLMKESIVTRWQIDPFSRGSFSYIGREATGADYEIMARPVGHSLFFAGEATCRSRPGTVHGAYISGLKSASEILTSLIGDVEVPHPLIPSKDGSSSRLHSAPPGQIKFPPITSINSPDYPSAPTTFDQQPVGITSQIRPQLSRHKSSNNALDQQQVQQPAPQPQSEGLLAPPPHALKRSSSFSDDSFITEREAKLKSLREARLDDDNERMRADMIKELGHRPVKPERSGANPFLIFQKDFWEICRKETDARKQKTSKDPNARATRNEVRAALGKMWRELPEDKKEPYLKATQEIKDSNQKNLDEYKQVCRVYDADAEDFRRRWKEEKASEPSKEEHELASILQELKESRTKTARKKHHYM